MNRFTTLKRAVATLGVAAAFTLSGCGSIAGQDSPADDMTGGSVAATPVEQDEPEPVMPTAKDFTVTLKTTSKQCFGSAGCNVTVEPDITYSGVTGLDGVTCDITYEITGDESGTVVETAIGDAESVSYYPTMLSTPSSSTEVDAKVNDVSCY